MRATRAVAYAPRTLSWEEFDLPDTPPAGALLVRTTATLISTGTELANWTGITADRAAMGADWRERPYRPGYSLVGVVLAVGEGVQGFAPGDRISGHGPHASAAVLEARRCTPVTEAVSDAAATFGTLGPIVLNGVRRAHLALGESLAVVGLGLIGQLAGMFGRLHGARPVVGLDLWPERRRIAEALAFDHALAPDDPSARAPLAAWGSGGGYAVVIEATGHPDALVPSLALAAPGGRVVALGSTRGVVPNFDLYGQVHLRGLTLIGAHITTHPAQATVADRWTETANRALTLRLIAAGELPVERLITHRAPAAEAPALFALLADRRREALGVVLEWGG